MLDKMNNLIDEQIKGKSKNSLEAGIARMIKKIVGGNRQAAEIITADLKNKNTTISKCAEKLLNHAKSNQDGNSYVMTDDEAENLIKEFYGLTELPDKPDMKSMSLLDLI